MAAKYERQKQILQTTATTQKKKKRKLFRIYFYAFNVPKYIHGKHKQNKHIFFFFGEYGVCKVMWFVKEILLLFFSAFPSLLYLTFVKRLLHLFFFFLFVSTHETDIYPLWLYFFVLYFVDDMLSAFEMRTL